MRNYFKKVVLVLRHPNIFFEELKKEKEIKEATIYSFIILFLSILLSFVDILIIQPISRYYLPMFYRSNQLGFDWMIFSSAGISLVILFLMNFVIAMAFHFWIKLWGGKGKYFRTYQLYVYSLTPSVLLRWLPVINVFGGLYSVFLIIIGVEKLHDVSQKRSFFLVITTFLAVLFWELFWGKG